MIPPDPIERFRSVYALAEKIDRSIIPEPNAMSLGTIEEGGQPSVRIVLLKGFDERGFVFYTNYEGRKGRELLAHPKAALCFYWPPLDIQVRIEGFNLFNQTHFNQPSGAIGTANFGKVTSAQDGRVVQLGIKYLF